MIYSEHLDADTEFETSSPSHFFGNRADKKTRGRFDSLRD
jgi:hypothetical protein